MLSISNEISTGFKTHEAKCLSNVVARKMRLVYRHAYAKNLLFQYLGRIFNLPFVIRLLDAINLGPSISESIWSLIQNRGFWSLSQRPILTEVQYICAILRI